MAGHEAKNTPHTFEAALMRFGQKQILVARRDLVCAFSLTAILITLLVSSAEADGWDTVSIIQHSTYQAVKADGDSAYTGGFPIRLRGVVLNNNEDWLDPMANYSTGLWDLGGEAEFYVQTVTPGDVGGTACWMGQNYGNLGFINDPYYNYSNNDWYAELDRLHLYRPDTALTEAQLVRTGDLVEIRARAGRHHLGKNNVNELHDIVPDNDFEIVMLQKDYGLPTPTPINLSNVKNAADVDIFMTDRTSGGELYQSTLVTIKDVCLTDPGGWGPNTDLTLTDVTGRTLPIHLGYNASFSTTSAPTGYFNVTGIFDQFSTDLGTDGYQLLAMNAGDFAAVPEPSVIVLLIVGAAVTLLRYPLRKRFGPRN